MAMSKNEVRRYILGVMLSMLDNDLGDPAGWFFGGLDEEDVEAVREDVRTEMVRIEKRRKKL